MATIHQIPDELLVDVASELAGSIEQSALLSLALVSRRFRNIAQGALYRFPFFRPREGYGLIDGIIVTSDSVTHGGPTPPLYLLRTLFERQDLAATVRTLDLAVYKEDIVHPHTCRSNIWVRGCNCGLTEIGAMAMTTLSNLRCKNGLWMECLHGYHEMAFAGVLLCLMPGLTHLNIQPFSLEPTRWRPNNDGSYSTPGIEFRAKPFATQDFFSVNHHDFEPATIPGLANLPSISTNDLLPWNIISAPNLRTLEFVFADARWHVLNIFPVCARLPVDPTPSEITTLILQIPTPCAQSYTVECERNKLHEYIGDLLQFLPKLKSLSLQLTKKHPLSSSAKCPRWVSSYDNLICRLYSASLETLIIDTANIGRLYPYEDSQVYRVDCEPMFSMDGFPNLRKIVAPQEAFFYPTEPESLWEPPETITAARHQYPKGIESIGVIDSTEAIKRFLRSLLLDKAHFTKLTTIHLWLDRYKDHVVEDRRLPRLPMTIEDAEEDVDESMEDNEDSGSDMLLDEDNDLPMFAEGSYPRAEDCEFETWESSSDDEDCMSGNTYEASSTTSE